MFTPVQSKSCSVGIPVPDQAKISVTRADAAPVWANQAYAYYVTK